MVTKKTLLFETAADWGNMKPKGFLLPSLKIRQSTWMRRHLNIPPQNSLYSHFKNFSLLARYKNKIPSWNNLRR